jgi:hypothetical protein
MMATGASYAAWIEYRDLGKVLAHEGSLPPHPAKT